MTLFDNIFYLINKHYIKYIQFTYYNIISKNKYYF